eukprot:Hpha_TRINITY_DN16382_c1_g5::TRINITY_DN16382_c1_g5_i1::g.62597::m.62597
MEFALRGEIGRGAYAKVKLARELGTRELRALLITRRMKRYATLAGVGGGTPSPPPPEQSNEPFQLVINPAQSAGIEMQARFITHGASLYLQLQITNNTGQPASDFQMQLNTNVWGIGLGELLQMQGALENGGVHRQQVLMSLQGQRKKHEGISEVSLQFALRSSVNTAYGTMKFNVALFFDNAAVALAKSRWLELWRVFEREVVFMVDRVAAPEADSVSARRFVESKLTNHGLHLIAKRSADGMHNVYWSLRTLNAVDVLIEVHQTDANPSQCKVSVRMSDEVYFPPVCEWVSEVLGQA